MILVNAGQQETELQQSPDEDTAQSKGILVGAVYLYYTCLFNITMSMAAEVAFTSFTYLNLT